MIYRLQNEVDSLRVKIGLTPKLLLTTIQKKIWETKVSIKRLIYINL